MAISNNPMIYCSKVNAAVLINSINQIDILLKAQKFRCLEDENNTKAPRFANSNSSIHMKINAIKDLQKTQYVPIIYQSLRNMQLLFKQTRKSFSLDMIYCSANLFCCSFR